MGINTQIHGFSEPDSRYRVVGVGSKRNLRVEHHEPDPPPVGESSRYRFYNSVLGTTGADSGTTNQNVNGASTAVEFYISATEDYDIRVMAVVIIIADTAIVHNAFGNVSALSTGYDLTVVESGQSTSIINKAKTGGQMIAQAGLYNSYGDGTTAFELSNWTATEDAQTIVIPMGVFIPGGLRIGRGTKDKLVATVNDDLTGLTEFTVRVIGYRHYP